MTTTGYMSLQTTHPLDVYQLLRIPYISDGTCRIMAVFYTYSNYLKPIEFEGFEL